MKQRKLHCSYFPVNLAKFAYKIFNRTSMNGFCLVCNKIYLDKGHFTTKANRVESIKRVILSKIEINSSFSEIMVDVTPLSPTKTLFGFQQKHFPVNFFRKFY